MQQDDIWSRDCFEILPLVVIQRYARVCQRQLSYLLHQMFNVSALLLDDALLKMCCYRSGLVFYCCI